jgi:hypothetical protein
MRRCDSLVMVMQSEVQRVPEEELTAFLEAEPHERIEERKGYKNGYKPRTLVTRAGAQSPDSPLTLMTAPGQPVTQSMHPLQKYAKRGTIR